MLILVVATMSPTHEEGRCPISYYGARSRFRHAGKVPADFRLMESYNAYRKDTPCLLA